MKRIVFWCMFLFMYSVSTLYAEKAPRFALLNSKNKLVFKSNLRDNIIIVFWASWCQPCKKEIPHLLLLEKKYFVTKNLKLVLISVDDKKSGEPMDKARRTLEEIGVEVDFLQDFYHVVYKKYTKNQQLLKIPAVFLVDKKNNIIFKEIGSHKDSMLKLEEAIKKLKK